jgi:uncharacterized protein
MRASAASERPPSPRLRRGLAGALRAKADVGESEGRSPSDEIALDDLRRLAVARSLFPPTTLRRAVERLGFVQADPIRAPARAQDLILRHRVKDYHAGDLERRFSALGIAEDVFINYGFVTPALQELMHPRARGPRPIARTKAATSLLAFVRNRGEVHPRHLVAHFGASSVTNYWGGSSAATTHLLDKLHYLGLLRVTRREAGIRLYAVHDHPPRPSDATVRDASLDALVDVVVNCYAPVPSSSLAMLVARLRYAVPQWRVHLRRALVRAKARLSFARAGGVDWYWPAGEPVPPAPAAPVVRFLAPFDPVVWDRARFERLWGWAYRFEAYTPEAKRQLGYYALPLLWRDTVIGWGNVSVQRGRLHASIGYVASRPPKDPAFRPALAEELARFERFLGLTHR